MTTALLAAVLVLAMGASMRPRPHPRPLRDPEPATRQRGPHPRSAARHPRHRQRVTPLELAGWCDALARSLRGGATLRHALCSVAPPEHVADALDTALLALDRGAATADALDAIEHAPPHLDLVLVVLRACARHGGSPAEPIDRAAAALRQRAASIAERESQSAQARMSALVMTLLPGVLLMVLLATSSSVRGAVTSFVGACAVGLGAAANALGWWWMRRLIRGRAAWA